MASEVRLLDGFHLYDNEGHEVGIPSGARRLVAYLALTRTKLPRGHVAAQLWTDSTDSCALASLRTAVSTLRHLGCDVIEANREEVVLAPDVVVDIDVPLTRAHALCSDPSTALDPVNIDAFTGSLLPDWYDDWVLFERERVRQAFLHAIEELANRLTASGRYLEALDTALAGIRVEPLREGTWRALIAAHLAEGNRGEAIRSYQSFERLLRTELGVEPSRATSELVAARDPVAKSS